MREINWDHSGEITEVNSFLKKLRTSLLGLKTKSLRPTNIAVVGSFLLRTVCSSNRNVDVVVYMPGPISEQSLRDHQYLSLRGQYVKDLVTALQAESYEVEVCRSFGEKSCVVVRCGTALSWRLKLHPALDEATALAAAKDQDLVQEDTSMHRVLTTLHDTFTQYPHCVSAVALLKEWRLRVGFSLSSTALSFVVRNLCMTGVITTTTTWDQIVRLTFAALSSGTKTKQVLTKLEISPGFNSMFRVTENDRLRAEGIAKDWNTKVSDMQNCLVDILCHSDTADSEEDIFWRSWDVYLRVLNFTTPTKAVPLTKHVEQSGLILLEALSGRVTSYGVHYEEDAKDDGQSCNVVYGWRFNGEDTRSVASRQTRGPTYDDESEVAKFKKFWGESIVETRRQFSDGSVRVVIVL